VILQGDATHIPLTDNSIHCVVTSPPYWGLRSYLPEGDSDKALELGLEPTPELYVEHLVAVFREVWRVLRDDGTCWVNMGDSYASASPPAHGGWDGNNKNPDGSPRQSRQAGDQWLRTKTAVSGLKPKDLVGIPWRVAFALQADGWWLRSDIIWHKPNPMPESVTDRPTKSHEYVFLLTKRARYYYDNEAVKEASVDPESHKGHNPRNLMQIHDIDPVHAQTRGFQNIPEGKTYPTRNRRTVWTIATRPYKGAHFACYPPALIEPCIKAGTSERGACPKCGAPWERVTEKTGETNRQKSERLGFSTKNPVNQGINCAGGHGDNSDRATTTIGWRPTCECDAGEPVPCVVLDPFGGSGTTAMVALQLGRRYVSMDLSAEYLELQRERTAVVQPVMAGLA